MHQFTTRLHGPIAALGAATLYVLVTVAICVHIIPSQPHLTRRYVAVDPHALHLELPASDGRDELAPQLRQRASAAVAETLHSVPGVDAPRGLERRTGFVDGREALGRRWLLWDQLRSRAPPLRALLRS